MRSIRRHLSFANVVACTAMFIALGGASYAAIQLPKNSVGAKQIKKNAVTTAKIKKGAVTGAKIQLSSLGPVPLATHATSATNAASAEDSARLGGAGPSSYVPQVARSGETLTGQISQHYNPESEFFLAGGSYRSPLPASTPAPTLVYVESGSGPGCPGEGVASPGVLCVYGYNTNNLEKVEESGNFFTPNRRFGFSLDIFPEVITSEAWLIATWAYQVP